MKGMIIMKMEDYNMTKKDMIMEAIESLGYKPYLDEDGDICVCYQMKSIYFVSAQEEEQYVAAIFPQFSEVKEGEDVIVLAACNKVSRDVKLAKVYIDQSLKNVSASCEFFYTDMESLKNNVEYALSILGMIRSAYHRARVDFGGSL